MDSSRTEYRALEGFVLAVSPFNFTAIGGNLPGGTLSHYNSIWYFQVFIFDLSTCVGWQHRRLEAVASSDLLQLHYLQDI